MLTFKARCISSAQARSSLWSESRLSSYIFVGKHYWVYLGSSGLREIFRRVPAKRITAKPHVRLMP
jgi:hypothetical protein